MRLDLFLKASRLVKHRTIAQELCNTGRVLVNGTVAKPAKEIRSRDRLRLVFAARTVEIEVLSLPATHRNIQHSPEVLYRVTEDKRLPQKEME